MCFERRRGGCRDEPRRHPFDGRGELAEALGLQRGDDFCSGTGELDRVVHDYGTAGAANRVDDGVDVQRYERAQVDDLGADAVLGQRLCRCQAFEHAAAVTDEGDVRAGTLDVGLAERDRESRIGWDRALLALQADRLDEQAGVLVEDRRRQQALTVARCRRHDHLHPRYVHEPRLQRLRMRRPGREPAVNLGAHGDRRGGPARGHEAQLGGIVDQLVCGDADEVHDHDLGDRQQPVDRRPDRRRRRSPPPRWVCPARGRGRTSSTGPRSGLMRRDRRCPRRAGRPGRRRPSPDRARG